MDKIVVGKPATQADAYDSVSYVPPAVLNPIFVAAYQHNAWKAGMMEWQFRSDSDSAKIDEALSGLIS